MAEGYCEPDDVRLTLQERDLSGAIDTPAVEPAIAAVSDWLKRTSRRHWYDSTGSAGDTVPTTTASATDVRRDVPSSPHATDRQIHHHDRGVRYPVTRSGPYAKVALPHGYVQSVDALRVRKRAGGGVVDWTVDSSKTEGRGEDYYVAVDGTSSYGRSYLYVYAPALGARTDYTDLLTLDYQHGLDAAETEWQDVRRGVALLAGAQLVVDDDVLTALPDNGQLVGVDTERQQLLDDAMDLLDPYLTSPTAV